jgi:hypothetical protein
LNSFALAATPVVWSAMLYRDDVKPFVDLAGASGELYRFRRAEGGLSPAGGNFVYVREVDGETKVVCCGKARSLTSVLMGRIWISDENALPDDTLYIRLNAASRVRDAEHEDLIAGLPRQFVILEME